MGCMAGTISNAGLLFRQAAVSIGVSIFKREFGSGVGAV